MTGGPPEAAVPARPYTERKIARICRERDGVAVRLLNPRPFKSRGAPGLGPSLDCGLMSRLKRVYVAGFCDGLVLALDRCLGVFLLFLPTF
jgi:hypothetical protein